MYKYLWIIIFVISCQSHGKNESENPSIILIMTDDQGWMDAGFNGNTELKTPNLDYLASKGIIFDRFYSASAVCSPTRASLITGRNPLRMGIPTANQGHMKKEEITIAELLKDEGYATAHFGKWHLGTLTKVSKDANRGGTKNQEHFSIPTMHGYDYFFCTESKVPTYDPMLYPTVFEEGESKRFGWKAVNEMDSTKLYGTFYWIGDEIKENRNLHGDDSRLIMDRVIPFIQNSTKEGKSFFTTIWFHTPHLPVVADEAHRKRYGSMDLQKQIYYGTITAMDEQIGRLWNMLEEQGLEDNTMIWFCSDNGPENGTPGSAGIFRERKRSLYEGGVRVPAFVYWKNHFDKKIRVDFPAVSSDYLPTILDILDMDYPDDRPVDGESLLPLLNGTQQEREKSIGFLFAKKMSWVTNRYKLISINNGKSFELYDLIDDQGEKDNILSKYPEVVKKMKKELYDWIESVENSNIGDDYISVNNNKTL